MMVTCCQIGIGFDAGNNCREQNKREDYAPENFAHRYKLCKFYNPFHPDFFFVNIILSIGNEAIATKNTSIYAE